MIREETLFMAKLENVPRIFTENDFVSMLLPLLKENGVVRVNEFELERKLYYYYLKEEYRELFQDIVPSRVATASDKLLNINNGLLNYKTFGGVVWTDFHPENLILCGNIDSSIYSKYLTADGVSKMKQMARELGIRNRIEEGSMKPLNIYGTDPNRLYHLCTGNYYTSLYGWDLITDGAVKSLQVDRNPNSHLQYESPRKGNFEVCLKNAVSTTVEIENASYVVMQGFENDTVRRLKVYTNILDLDKLKQFRDIDVGDDKVVSGKEKPYVKKYYLN